MNHKAWAFAVYSILFEAIVWGLFGWAVFIKGFSGWWMGFALLLSASQLKPKAFGIGDKPECPPRGGKPDPEIEVCEKCFACYSPDERFCPRCGHENKLEG